VRDRKPRRDSDRLSKSRLENDEAQKIVDSDTQNSTFTGANRKRRFHRGVSDRRGLERPSIEETRFKVYPDKMS
jgi:hypothetical protein